MVEQREQVNTPGAADAADAAADAAVGAPAPPREITPRARRRAWAELGVRGWWLSAVGIALIAVAVAVLRVSAWADDRQLVEQGTRVEARVDEIGGSTVPHLHARDEPVGVALSYVPQDGGDGRQTLRGWLSRRPGESVRVGMTIPVRVDPADPARWTDRTETRPLVQELVIAWLLLPVVVLLLLIARWRRGRVLEVYRTAPAAEAVVVEARPSSAAPMSRLLRLRLKDDAEKRVFPALYPNRAGAIAAGDTLRVVTPPGQPARSVIISLYH